MVHLLPPSVQPQGANAANGMSSAALYFAFNVLPGVADKAKLIAREDRTALDIPAAAFAP